MESRLICTFLMMLFTALCSTVHAEGCSECHGVPHIQHGNATCVECHVPLGEHYAQSASLQSGAGGCVVCHAEASAMTRSAMHTRSEEKHFARHMESFDGAFFDKNCEGCHVASCMDCHQKGEQIVRPETETCLTCHSGMSVGMAYVGKAIRQDHARYKRGDSIQGKYYLNMLPDVHFEKGMACADCHRMEETAQCRDCHKPDSALLDHSIPEHLEKMTCSACHSAWAVQEFGTFYLRFTGENRLRRTFASLTQLSEEYYKSAVLTEYGRFSLGVDANGRYAPIRPSQVALGTHFEQDTVVGTENHLFAAEWRVFEPHTVRRETVLCTGCHGNSKTLMRLEGKTDRYQIRKDGVPLDSFWGIHGQRVVNGSFVTDNQSETLMQKSAEYTKKYVEKWKKLITFVEQ